MTKEEQLKCIEHNLDAFKKNGAGESGEGFRVACMKR